MYEACIECYEVMCPKRQCMSNDTVYMPWALARVDRRLDPPHNGLSVNLNITESTLRKLCNADMTKSNLGQRSVGFFHRCLLMYFVLGNHDSANVIPP